MYRRSIALLLAALTVTLPALANGPGPARDPVLYVDQGPDWTPPRRAEFYVADQGSRLIPYAWLAALKETDGRPFLRDQLSRYGFLPNDTGATDPSALPVGFHVAEDSGILQTGITCAACHVRQITRSSRTYRIDGGPGIVDFESFFRDLDSSVHRTATDPAAFAAFKLAVEGAAGDGVALHDKLTAWSVRFRALMSRSLPQPDMWGLGRMDALSMIFNQLTGLDLGTPPLYLIPENIRTADAPVRYPFLWNSTRQDFTQWSGIAPNGNDAQGLSRNLGEVYGVFAVFHPKPDASEPLGLDYLANNSANWQGLQTLEELVRKIGPPQWPWSVSRPLAQRGAQVFEAECAQCHGISQGESRGNVTDTWKTPVLNVGTDTAQWRVLLRLAATGVMNGASLPDGAPGELGEIAPVAVILLTATHGALQQRFPGIEFQTQQFPSPYSYSSRVLEGIWAAPPYLHNGSVRSLRELLEPASRRATRFEVGPVYDAESLGLAQRQPAGRRYLRVTTGCDLASGNSNCGHEYGTRLPAQDKKALLEYLKTL